MKEITKELIDKTIEEVSDELFLNSKDLFFDNCKKFEKEFKNNTVAYDMAAMITAQCNAANIMREVLYRLLID